MDWKDVLTKVAPTAATILAGPFAGLVVEGLGTVLGVPDATVKKVQDALTAGQLNGDQIVALRKLEQDLTVRLKELDIQVEQIAAGDRDSARKRESAVGDSTNRILAYTVVGSFVALVGSTLLGYTKVDSVLAGTLVGYLSAKAEQVLAYYFGSTKGSADKTAMLAEVAKTRN